MKRGRKVGGRRAASSAFSSGERTREGSAQSGAWFPRRVSLWFVVSCELFRVSLAQLCSRRSFATVETCSVLMSRLVAVVCSLSVMEGSEKLSLGVRAGFQLSS